LLEIQRQDHSFPAEPNISCKLNSQSRISKSPRKIRKKKKRQILPPCPPQTLEPKKTGQTQHFPTNGPTAKTRRDAPAFIRTTELVPEVQTQHPPNSEPIIRSALTKITPQSRRSPTPSPLHNLYRRIRLDTSPSSNSQTTLPTSYGTHQRLSRRIRIGTLPPATQLQKHRETTLPTSLFGTQQRLKRRITDPAPSY
jgi:hypothetical protein